MAASINDKITDTRNAARPNSARATGTRTSGGSSLACDNLAGWPTASKVHFVTYQVDSNSNPVAGTQLDCTGIVTGNNIGSFTVIDGTDTGNSINDYVEMLPTSAWGQDLSDALSVVHERTGSLKAGAVDVAAVLASNVVTTSKILNDNITAAKLADDSVFPANLTAGLSGSTWAWQSWTPSWTNVTVGNGTVNAYYVQIGKAVSCRLDFTWGSTTSASGNFVFSLPVTAANYAIGSRTYIGSAWGEDLSTQNYKLSIALNADGAGGTTAQILVEVADATYTKLAVTGASAPFVWATGDRLGGSFSYEAA